MDGSAGKRSDTGPAALSLGLRYAAMSLETSRHGFQLELSRAGLVQFAERVVLPDYPRRHHAHGGFVFARVSPVRRVARAHAFCDYFPYRWI